MQLTDAEIREILIREKKRIRRRKKKRRRISLLIFLMIVLATTVVFIMHREELGFFNNRGIIFIDPGHGGEDPGSHTEERMEKDDNLSLALEVRDYLKRENFKVVMSRSDDTYIARDKRGLMANEASADLMISLHRNKVDGEGEGVEIFIPSPADKKSLLLGNNIMKGLVKEGFSERAVRAGTLFSEEENYAENSYSLMPSCLVEVGFISDAEDNRLFDNNKKQNAKAIALAIIDTFEELYEADE